MQAAGHWDVLAADVANRLQAALVGAGNQSKTRSLSLYVEQPRYNSEFGVAFHGLLMTHLMERGFRISENPGSGLPVVYQIQVVGHNDRGFIRPVPGLFTALSGSVAAVHGVADAGNTASAWLLGAVLADVGTGFVTGGTPDHEIIITTSVMEGGHYVTRLRDIYYISDENVDQYIARVPSAAPPSTRMMEVVGP
ncbi:MAG: hypothetical protein CSA09_02880 [Candidatus Contendobacter odensis]|uniref:Uncharacterized protein n=1 Tax=Candidatus Contendibacter odensensis TaxID=1400860 RepID=A0A2G6PF99_9GAMM|nr:MAG: hypothetical protein CSA09_02880 [Candidatus Contendobacter odensis]